MINSSFYAYSSFLVGAGVGAFLYWAFFGHTPEEEEILNQHLLDSNNNNNNNINSGHNQHSTPNRHRRSKSNSLTLSQEINTISALTDLLQNTLIEYILNDETHQVITIDSTSSLDYALMRMSESNVNSLPVVDLQFKKYIGMLSIIDIASFLSQFPSKDSPNTPVSEVLKYNREPFLPLFVNSPIQLLIHIMTHHVSQVPIMSNQTIVVDIVSRLNVIKFIHENIESLGPKSNLSVRGLGILSESISIINSNQTVLDAIKLLNLDQVTELAVVDENKKIIGCFSASDLRKLSVYSFNRCTEPISQFIKLNPEELNYITPSSTLRSAVRKFAENDAQTLWIVDTQMQPVSSITQRSLMKYFLNLSTQITNNNE
eukprot:gene497-625_t